MEHGSGGLIFSNKDGGFVFTNVFTNVYDGFMVFKIISPTKSTYKKKFKWYQHQLSHYDFLNGFSFRDAYPSL